VTVEPINPSSRLHHRGLAIRLRHALVIGAALIVLFILTGGYPALIGASLLGVGPVLYVSRARASSVASFLPVPLALIGGIAAQALFGPGHIVLRLLLGMAAGAFAGVALSLIAMTFDMRRDVHGAAA
jgi:hypothetical protein